MYEDRRVGEGIKVYCYYTDSYEILVDQWLMPSFKDSRNLILRREKDQGVAVDYKKHGWQDIVRNKTAHIIQAVRENWNKVFIFMDPDIQFFDNIEARALELIKNLDLVIQRDCPGGTLCSGFFAMRGNDKTLALWQEVLRLIDKGKGDDQDCLNYLLNRRWSWETRFFSKVGLNFFGIKWDYLPREFLSGGTLTGKPWLPGQALEIPRDTILHHANFTVGLRNKISQLEYVRQIVEERNRWKFFR